MFISAVLVFLLSSFTLALPVEWLGNTTNLKLITARLELRVQKKGYVTGLSSSSGIDCSNEGLYYISTEARCEYRNVTISCKESLRPGTIAHLTCRHGYRTLRHHVSCQNGGEWDYPPWNQCQEICNDVNENVDYRNYIAPWNVVIYKFSEVKGNFDAHCMGSIITSKLILTLRKCVNVKFSNLRIGVGKQKTDYMAEELMPYQILNISAALDYGMIRLVIVHGFIIFQKHVAPICLDKNTLTIIREDPSNVIIKLRDNHFRNREFVMLSNMSQLSSKRFGKVGYAFDEFSHQRTEDDGAGFLIPINSNGSINYVLFGMQYRPNHTAGNLLFTNFSDIIRIKPILQFHQFYHIIVPQLESHTYFPNEYCSMDYWSDPSVIGSCSYNNISQLCTQPILPNTKVEINCQTEFRSLNDSYVCNEIGEWVGSANPCEPICTLGNLPPYQKAFAPNKEEIASGAVDNYSLITFTCNNTDNYIMDGKSEILCVDGTWTPNLPTCHKYCPPIEFNNKTTIAVCKHKNYPIACAGLLKPGSIAYISCHFGYERPSSYKQDLLTCHENGTWSDPVYTCTIICGSPTPDGITYITDGERVNITSVPWHVAIYRLNKQICGGTIINRRVVLSAAHCFYRENILLDASHFRVVSGKYYCDFVADENGTQTVSIRNIEIPKKYNGLDGLYEADIAALILEDFLILRHNVMPICIDNEDDRIPLTVGRVAGWGLTTPGGNSSNELQRIDLPIIEREQCLNSSSEFRRFVTIDKICAGFMNAGTSVCKGDSGGGLVVSKNSTEKVTYYLLGIVSLGQMQDSCDDDKYSLFTWIHSYIEFIKNTNHWDAS